jgi:2-octaprenyl-6-methoxyphenol hydroxylase
MHEGAETTDVAVVGGGPAGLTAAVALAAAGVRTALIAPPHPGDNRTTALLAGSVAALDALGAWERAREHAEPMRAIRLIDDRGGLLRAPEVTFDAHEIGLDAFGYNIANTDLVAALEARARALPLQRHVAKVTAVAIGDDAVTLALEAGASVRARLVVAADGKQSLCREAAGIETEHWSYPQSALTCNVAHARPHGGISTEFHTRHGPFTLVPLAGNRSSLVWVMAPEDAARRAALDDQALAREIERQAHSMLGKVQAEPGRGLFPLSGLRARTLAADRIVLVGEAAHVLPPIGAQGFNLGLRDAATIADVVADALRVGSDPGGADALRGYADRRRADVASRTLAVDLLNRSLLTDFIPLQGLRGIGLALLERIGPLRRAMMREGVSPVGRVSRQA